MAGLPRPTGPHAVGRTARDWTDPDRADPYARRPAARRLAVWIWYPAIPTPAPPAPYLPGLWKATALAMGIGGGVRPHAVRDTVPAQVPTPWPVIVFSPSGNPPLVYAALLEELASHGYVVAGISHTYESMPMSVFADGRARLMRPGSLGGAFAAPGARPFEVDLRERAHVVSVKAADIRFVIEALRREPPRLLRGRLDTDRVVAVGHSFGGGAAAEVCRHDPVARAGVSLDGGLWRAPGEAGVETPFLQVFGEHPEYTLPCAEVVKRGLMTDAAYCAADRTCSIGAWQALHDSARPGLTAKVVGAKHAGFFDTPMLPLRRWSPLERLRGAPGPAAWRATADVLLAFLDRHLRDGDGAFLDDLADDPRYVVAPPAELFSATAR
jgi:dienelactone hydrolase